MFTVCTLLNVHFHMKQIILFAAASSVPALIFILIGQEFDVCYSQDIYEEEPKRERKASRVTRDIMV